MATFGEALRQPVQEDQPEIMKRFAAQWVLHVYTEWEEYYRGALAKALGCEKEDIRSDYFADLGRMRQDYVHKARGICKEVVSVFVEFEVAVPHLRPAGW
jgi:hypothetical protein